MQFCTRALSTTILTLLMLFGSLPAHAEEGDYSWWRTFLNLFNPPGADNPVNDSDTQGMYPLAKPESGFNYGYDPKRYYAWQKIEVPASTGAACGNGSPYKFFVSTVPNTKNTLIYMEGGGACWDYESCSGQSGIRGARNPNGIPDNYMEVLDPTTIINTGSIAQVAVTPFIFRAHPWDRVKTQNWNLVYIPYCTGDIYVGDKAAVYEDPKGEKPDLVWLHNGLKNTRSVITWLKNNLPRPIQMMTAGCSAGSVGALLNYMHLREDMAPNRSYLFDDSGPVFRAPYSSTDSATYPQLPLQKTIIDAWTTWTPNGDPMDENPLNAIQERYSVFDTNDWSSIYSSLANRFPSDRLGMTHFLDDANYSSYSYERFYENIYNDPDAASRLEKIKTLWQQDTFDNLIPLLDQTHNWGYYFPRYRNVNESHCTSIIEFGNADIQEQNLVLKDFVNNIMDGTGPMMRAHETDEVSDYQKPFNLLYWLVGQLL